MGGESSDIESHQSHFEEERELGASDGGKPARWSLGKKVAVGLGVIAAVLLVILMPIVLSKDGGNSPSAASTSMNDVSTQNVGVGTDGSTAESGAVDVAIEDPSDSVGSPTDSVPTEEEANNETPVPTPSPTNTPKTLAPVSTETVCSMLNVTSENTTSWVEITDKIIGESASDLSGRSIAMSADGSILAIAAAMNSDNAQRAGHVRVYQYVSGEYSQLGQDLDGEAEFDWFGTSIALDASGLRLAVGGRWNDGQQGNDTGHVRLFDFSDTSGSWEKIGDDLEGGAQGDQFGRSVALSADGTRLAVGASYADESANVTDVGHVYLYDISDGSFLSIGQFQGDSGDDLAGSSLSLSEDGSHVAIAATLHDAPNGMPDVGQVKIYHFDSGAQAWSKVGSNIEGNAPGARAGLTVALSFDGSRIAVSYPQSIMGLPAPGITRIYELQDGLWERLGSNDLIGGHSVSMSRDGRVAVGDYLGYTAGNNAGFVHVYEHSNEANAWDLVGQVINGIRGEMSGTAVALSADGLRLAISSPRDSPDGLEDVGAVRVYDLC